VAPGKTQKLYITISSSAATGQYFGEVRLTPRSSGLPKLHLPVAFIPQQGTVNLASSCTPTTIKRAAKSVCSVTATNRSFADAVVDLTTVTDVEVPISSVSGATKTSPFTATKKDVTLTGAKPGTPSIAPGESPAGGYLDIGQFGITPTAIGDESLLNFNAPGLVYNGQTYNSIGVDSNGYIVVGGGGAQDNNCCNLNGIPDAAPPNNVLAPFWTDLDGTGQRGLLVGSLTDGISDWLVVQWEVADFGTNNVRRFQAWFGLNGTQDISFTYDATSYTAAPADPAQPFQIGAENVDGSGGEQLPPGEVPTGDLVVTSTPPVPGGSVTYTVTVTGLVAGTGTITTTMKTPVVPGTTVVKSTVTVTK
jgi:hypothetical protein